MSRVHRGGGGGGRVGVTGSADTAHAGVGPVIGAGKRLLVKAVIGYSYRDQNDRVCSSGAFGAGVGTLQRNAVAVHGCQRGAVQCSGSPNAAWVGPALAVRRPVV